MADKQIKQLDETTSIANNDVFVVQRSSSDATNKVKATNILPDDSVTDTKLDYPRWWQEIARTTLTGTSDTISVTSIPARTYLYVIVSCIDSGQISQLLRFNNDSGANYAYTTAATGAASTSSVSQTGFTVTGGATYPMNFTFEITNRQAEEKIGYFRRFHQATAGAGTAPTQMEGVFKWANTSAQINRIDITNSGGSGDFAIGSEVIVLGHD